MQDYRDSLKYVVFNFSQNVSDFISEELKFYVDEPLTLDINGKTLNVDSGIYDYDSSLGEFGGYKIPISFK